MPPKPKTLAQIEEERLKILDAALNIIAEQGYANLTMRLIASKCGFSATKIYYYFTNKEDVFFNVMEQGFLILIQLLNEAYEAGHTEKERFVNVCQGIFDFGINYPSYYEIMLSGRMPRCMDYTSSPLCDIATREKNRALEFYNLWEKSITELGATVGKQFNRYDTTQMFSLIHGAINLHHSNNLREIDVNYVLLSQQIIDHLCDFFN